MISRGISTGSTNVFVFVSDGTHTGIGECAPGAGYDETLAPLAEEQFAAGCPCGELPELSISEIWNHWSERELAMPALAGLDIALWDLKGKQLGAPLWSLFGLPRSQVATSVTIGLNPPEVTRERVPDILSRTGGKSLKIKLGSPDGTDFDMAHFTAAAEAAAPFGVKLRVDANGGWSVETARRMMAWLAERGVDYVEQPLVEGNEDGLPHLYEGRPLPIFVDESCRTSADIPKWAAYVDGINLKLMKCGGISEAVRIVATARAHGLQTMIGCMGESSVSIAAGASIGALFDHIDLDSHLNLDPDPARGLGLVDGVLVPSDAPGHGAELTV
jgi:L-alanine-DL-glutamate epimerase-like enolase superfamily enzyme